VLYKLNNNKKLLLHGDLTLVKEMRENFYQEFANTFECVQHKPKLTNETVDFHLITICTPVNRLKLSQEEAELKIQQYTHEIVADNVGVLIILYGDLPLTDYPLYTKTSVMGKQFTISFHITAKTTLESQSNKTSVDKLKKAIASIKATKAMNDW